MFYQVLIWEIGHMLKNKKTMLRNLELGMLIGLGLFILWYSFLLLLFHSLGLDLIWTIIFFITFIPTGNFSLYYFRKAKNYQQHIRFLTIFYQKRILLYQLIEKRLSIINELNKAKDDYFAKLKNNTNN